MGLHIRIFLVVALVAVAPRWPAAQGTRSAERLYLAYASGDDRAIAGALRTHQDYAAIHDDLQRLITAWKSRRVTSVDSTLAWSPTRPGFVFEVAVAIRGFEWTDGVRLLNAARDLVVMRPEGPAADRPDADDRFEVALHQAAVSLLTTFPGEAGHYLDDIAGRVTGLSRLPGGSDLTARLVLARGMVAETGTRPLATDSTLELVTGVPAAAQGLRASAAAANATRERERRLQLQQTERAFADAGRLPGIAAEASIRRGFVLHRLGNQMQALEALDHGLSLSRDHVVSYWGHLIRGRVLEATGRLSDARASYEHAAALMPAAQTAAVALASVLLMQNDRAGAEEWAAAARAGRGHGDPWWQYWFADSRLLDDLVATIRGARR